MRLPSWLAITMICGATSVVGCSDDRVASTVDASAREDRAAFDAGDGNDADSGPPVPDSAAPTVSDAGPDSSEPCEPATYVPSCRDDHRYYECINGAVRDSNPCGPSFVCVATAGSSYTCIDSSLATCDPATFTESCDHAPDNAVFCDQSGHIVHRACGTTNPTCVVAAGHAVCSFPAAPMCPLAAMEVCDASDSAYLLACSRGVAVRRQCLSSSVAPSCACRHIEISPDIFRTDCYTESGAPCASRDS